VIASERLYPIRRPLAAAGTGMAVAILDGLIGLGDAEFRLAILIAVFALYPQDAGFLRLDGKTPRLSGAAWAASRSSSGRSAARHPEPAVLA
jgi:hypothetical protein